MKENSCHLLSKLIFKIIFKYENIGLSLPTLVKKKKRKISATMGKSFSEQKGVKVGTERGSEELDGSCVETAGIFCWPHPIPSPQGSPWHAGATRTFACTD